MTVMIYKTIRETYFTYYIFIVSFSVVCEYFSIHPNINYLPSKSIAPFLCSACLEQILKSSEKELNSLRQKEKRLHYSDKNTFIRIQF